MHQERQAGDSADATSPGEGFVPITGTYVQTVNLCGRRLLQVERLKAFLLANGYPLVTNPEDAGTLMVVGCAFNNHTETVSRAALEERRRAMRPSQRLLALEGIADTCGERLVADGLCPDTHVIPTTGFDRLDPLFARRVPYRQVPDGNVPGQCDGHEPGQGLPSPRPAAGSESVFSVQVGTGCADCCTYCGDKPIVGALISRPIESILRQVDEGIRLGYTAIELIGDDVGCYGRDVGLDMTVLLDGVSARPGVERLSLLEVNVKYLVQHEAFLSSFLQRGLLRKVAVAFQSGSDRVLDRMARGYRAADVSRIARRLTDAGVWKHAHVIVGFPTESRDEWEQSLRVLLEGAFESATLFLYQDRPGTPASAMYPKVPEDEQRARLESARVTLANAGFTSHARSDKLQVCRMPAPR